MQFNKVFSGSDVDDSNKITKIRSRHLWFHSPELYRSYDTDAIISAYREEFANSELSDEAFEMFKKILGGANIDRNNVN